MGNLDKNLGGYFILLFIMVEVGNVDAYLGVTLCYFHNGIDGYLIIKQNRLMALIVRAIGLMAGCFQVLLGL